MPTDKQHKASAPNRPTTSTQKVLVYKTCTPFLEAMLKEIKELAKKKPDAVMSKANVTRVNRLLIDLRECLNDESTSKYLDLLDEDALPQYSDALIIMSQFQAALKAFHAQYFLKSGTEKDDEYGLIKDKWEWSVS
jgi:hypothetical protein